MSLHLPLLTDFAEKMPHNPKWPSQLERLGKAVKVLEDGLAAQHIWNSDYEDAKSTVSRLSEDLLKEADDAAKKLYYAREEGQDFSDSLAGKWKPNDPRHNMGLVSFLNVPSYLQKIKAIKDAPELAGYIAALEEVAQLATAFKAVTPFIEKGRKPAENPKEVDLTNTGICPVCFRRQKLTFDRKMVAHGYTLDSKWGGRNGMCYGQGYPAFELSSEGTEAHVVRLNHNLASVERELVKYNSGDIPSLTDTVSVFVPKEKRKNVWESYEKQVVTRVKGTPEYDQLLKITVLNIESSIRQLQGDIKMYTKLVSEWKLQPLMYGGAETQPRWKSRMLNKS